MRVVLHWAHSLPYKKYLHALPTVQETTLGRANILALGGSAKIIALPSVFLDIVACQRGGVSDEPPLKTRANTGPVLPIHGGSGLIWAIWGLFRGCQARSGPFGSYFGGSRPDIGPSLDLI